jgi:signal transduction histidine kinase
VVRPWPWWLRVWAWPLHAAALAGLVFVLVRWRTRTLQRRNRELEAHVNERTAQLRKASAVKEEFLASISHEIRNPLNGVVGICAMLSDLEVGPREKKLLRTLGGCADQLRSMLDDILDFSRLERGQIALTRGPWIPSWPTAPSSCPTSPRGCTAIPARSARSSAT